MKERELKGLARTVLNYKAKLIKNMLIATRKNNSTRLIKKLN
jgi:hypothetical protein